MLELYRRAAVQHVDVGTASLAIRRFGNSANETLLLIHGWPFSGLIWRKLLPALAERYACVTVDLAGAGDSTWKPTNDFSFHGHADNVQKAMRALGIERYALIAHDTGATVARRLAIIEGARVTKLIAIDTEIPHHRPPLVPLITKVLALPGANAAFRMLLRSKRFLRSNAGFGGCVCDLDLIDDEFIAAFITPLRESKERMDGQIRYARGIDWNQLDGLAEGHREIVGPVLLIWGDRDPFFPIARAREMIPQFRDCRGLIEIPDAKLLPHEEYPELVASHVVTFLSGR